MTLLNLSLTSPSLKPVPLKKQTRTVRTSLRDHSLLKTGSLAPQISSISSPIQCLPFIRGTFVRWLLAGSKMTSPWKKSKRSFKSSRHLDIKIWRRKHCPRWDVSLLVRWTWCKSFSKRSPTGPRTSRNKKSLLVTSLGASESSSSHPTLIWWKCSIRACSLLRIRLRLGNSRKNLNLFRLGLPTTWALLHRQLVRDPCMILSRQFWGEREANSSRLPLTMELHMLLKMGVEFLIRELIQR